jgi:hypothetical protein
MSDVEVPEEVKTASVHRASYEDVSGEEHTIRYVMYQGKAWVVCHDVAQATAYESGYTVCDQATPEHKIRKRLPTSKITKKLVLIDKTAMDAKFEKSVKTSFKQFYHWSKGAIFNSETRTEEETEDEEDGFFETSNGTEEDTEEDPEDWFGTEEDTEESADYADDLFGNGEEEDSSEVGEEIQSEAMVDLLQQQLQQNRELLEQINESIEDMGGIPSPSSDNGDLNDHQKRQVFINKVEKFADISGCSVRQVYHQVYTRLWEHEGVDVYWTHQQRDDLEAIVDAVIEEDLIDEALSCVQSGIDSAEQKMEQV